MAELTMTKDITHKISFQNKILQNTTKLTLTQTNPYTTEKKTPMSFMH